MLKKLHKLALKNRFNEKQTSDFIALVTSGTSVDEAIDLLRKLSRLAIDNLFNDKETNKFVELVKSGTSIDEAIDIVEEGISENESVEEIKEDVTTDGFNEEMTLEMYKFNEDLESLISKLGYDVDEAVSGGCSVISFWITIRVIKDREGIDNFYEYLLIKAPNTKVMCDVYASTFLSLDTYFEEWVKNHASGYDLGSEMLHTIVGLGDGSDKFPYAADQCGMILEFFSERLSYMLKKQKTLREKIKDEKYKPVKENVTIEKPTEQPKEVCSALDILDEAKYKLDSPAFEKVQRCVKLAIQENISDVVRIIREEQPPRHYVYSMIANVSGDWLESGEYHMYRGVLNPMGEGMLKLFDTTVDELVLIGACDKKFAKEQKKGVRANIKTVG